ncbi:MAG: ATP-dependent helicase, partial [Nanoarchaeota archaeon]
FHKTSVVVLYKNYRSGQEILDKAYNLIQFNNPDRLEIIEKIDKKLKSQNKTNGEVLFIHKKNVDEEAEEVCRIILKLVESGKYSYRDFAILVRANSHADPFVNTLERGGIPNQFLGPGKLFLQPEIVDIISVLKFLYDISDSVSLFRILSIKSLTIDATDLAIILSYARKKNLTLFESCERIVDMEISEDSKLKIKNIADLLHKKFSDISSKKAGQILYEFLVESNIFQNVLNDTSDGAELRASNLSKFFEKLKHLESENNDASITTVVDFINLSLEMGESPRSSEVDSREEDAVSIMTLHGAKGLEFPVVFLVNLVSQRFPSVERREQIPIPESLIREILPTGDYHLEEERRLFYVGMTRAKDKLFLTAAEFYGEGKRTKKLSPFVSEALGEKIVSSNQLLVVSKKLNFTDYETNRTLVTEHRSLFSVDYLSHSRIETFKMCPLHYKLKYIY